MSADAEWDARVDELWGQFPAMDADAFRDAMDALAAERPADDAAALMERGSSRDSTGLPEEAVGFYRDALANGLTGPRRRRAVIQMASSLRNLGDAEGSLALLEAEGEEPSDELDVAVAIFRGLALAELGRDREGLAHLIATLSPTLPRYNRSTRDYAAALLGHVDEDA